MHLNFLKWADTLIQILQFIFTVMCMGSEFTLHVMLPWSEVMSVRLSFAGLTLAHQLLRLSQRCLISGNAVIKGHTGKRDARSFVTTNRSQNDEEGESVSSTQLSDRRALLSRKRRSLSPLERISSLLPQDALGPDVTQLRGQNQEDPAQISDVSEPGLNDPQSEVCKDLNPSPPSQEEGRPRSLPGETLLQFGELLMAEHLRKRQVEFRKMFQLQPAGRLLSSWGVILHEDIVGQPAGRFLKTSRGVSILVRRPSLEDYVLYMKRGPNIAYPKVGARCYRLGVSRLICDLSKATIEQFPFFPSGRCHHASDDGCHWGGQSARIRLRVRSHVPVPV